MSERTLGEKLELVRQVMRTDRPRYFADEGMQALYRSFIHRQEAVESIAEIEAQLAAKAKA